MDASEGGWDGESTALESPPTSTVSSISFWMDRASKPESKSQESHDASALESHVNEKEVPLYDRACTSALFTQASGELSERYSSEEAEDVSRCFNCGSYAHSLNTCQRPRDLAAINSSRKMLLERKGSFARFRPAPRYYLDSSAGKFDDLRPGILGLETRKALGIGELDPPPWLHWMRNIGYPPGYLEDEEDEKPSGVEIFGGDIDAVGFKDATEDTSIEVVETVPVRKRMTVEFPGINSPIPEYADEKLWAPPHLINPDYVVRDQDV